jgi:antitoxin component YwqK of YwqJK toxin-antitoxin module
MRNIFILTVIWLFFSCSEEQNENNEENPFSELKIDLYSDGSPKLIGYTIGGEKTGEWREFEENGNISRQMNYINGKLNGKLIEYRFGELFSITSYKDGEPHGETIAYQIGKGELLEEGQYDMGKYVGLWFRYNDGELLSIREYRGDTAIYIYENPKFHQDLDVPPPPPKN